jgi:hypothetical protein
VRWFDSGRGHPAVRAEIAAPRRFLGGFVPARCPSKTAQDCPREAVTGAQLARTFLESETARVVALGLLYDSGSDTFARIIGAAGVGLGLLSLGLTRMIWHWSRPRLRVRIRINDDPGGSRLVVEVVSVGRLAVVLKSIGVRDHIVVPGTNVRPTTLLSLPVNPKAQLPLTLEPTEFLEADVAMDDIARRWDENKQLALVGWAEAGDGKRFESRPLKLQTPPIRRE